MKPEQELGKRNIKAFFYNDLDKSLSYVDVTMGDEQSLLFYLDKSSGKADPFTFQGTTYWVLESTDGLRFLLFRFNPVDRYESALPEDESVARLVSMA